jgi:putative phosphoribosyl transferase
MMRPIFRNRVDAGRQLGQKLSLHWREHAQPEPRQALVLGLPRGGVVVAAEVARAIAAPLDVLVVRKIGAPFHSELAIGAVADVDGRAEVVLIPEIIQSVGADDGYVRDEAEAEHCECLRRVRAYRGARAAPAMSDRDVVVVDDGIATGATVKAALQVVRRQQPRTLTLAVPVAPEDTLEELRRLVDDIVCLSSPPLFSSVGQCYQHFDQTTDDEVIDLLERAQVAD